MDAPKPAQGEPQDNLTRLKSHLKTESLAEKLVSARISAGGADLQLAMHKVVMDRIEELRCAYESVPDQQS